MIAYHGTTQTRARTILAEGLLPKPPSRRVWFAESRGYAMGRARTQASRTGDVPVVLACNLDLAKLRRQLSVKRVIFRKGIIAVDGPVPVEMFGPPTFADMATVPGEVAAWINDLLGLEGNDSVRTGHPGIVRLSRWINTRLASRPGAKLLASELLDKAKVWLPEHFVGATIDPEDLRAHRRVGLTDYEVDDHVAPDPREDEALECLDAPLAAERARGLSLLADVGAPDLFDWCAMFLDDEAVTVRIAALRTMLKCEEGTPAVIKLLAADENRRVRAAAIAALVRLAPDDAPRWIERGLRDPEICVRTEAVRFLKHLDPRRHRSVYDLAKHDPSPEVARRARRLAAGGRRGRPKT